MPNLAAVLDKIEEVVEGVRSFYTLKDGKFHLNVDGMVPTSELAAANAKVVEFRDNNIKMTQELDKLRPLATKFEGIDPDKAREALATVAKLDKKGVKDVDADLQKMITEATAAAVAPLQTQISTLTTEAKQNKERADEGLLRTTIQDKFIKAGGKSEPTITDFILGLARTKFVVDGTTVKANPSAFSADRPGEPLSVDEFIAQQTKAAPWAFKESQGGGTPPQGGGRPVVKDGVKILRNPTPAELGANATLIAQGKVRVENTEDAAVSQ